MVEIGGRIKSRAKRVNMQITAWRKKTGHWPLLDKKGATYFTRECSNMLKVWWEI